MRGHSRTPQAGSPAGTRSSTSFRTPPARATTPGASSEQNKSLLGQVSSFLGASWSRLSGRDSTEVVSEERPASSEPAANSGLNSLLDL